MNAICLERRKISALHVALTHAIGVGLSANLADGDTQAEVRITLPSPISTQSIAVDAVVLEGSFGEIEFADGIRFFRAISGIDIGMGGQGQRQWLSAAALGRLGRTPFAPADRLGVGAAADIVDAVTLRVCLRTPHHAFTVDARAGAGTWLNFIGCSAWLPERSPAANYGDLPITWPVKVASHSMNIALLDSIAPGDTVLPARTFFDCSGAGCVDLMGLRLMVKYRDFNRLEISSLEGSVNIESDSREEEPDTAPVVLDVRAAGTNSLQEEPDGDPAAAPARLTALERLPVKVDFELGHLQLSLAQLRTVGPGVVLQIEDASPASVAVTSSGRLLGRGEIVDVNGQLGIRIIDWGF